MEKSLEELISLSKIRSAVIRVSNLIFLGKSKDVSGPWAVSFLESAGSLVCGTNQVPDEISDIQQAIWRVIRENGAQLVVVIGGTGLSSQDVTPEAVEEICDFVIPGFGECFRLEASRQTSVGWLSRAMGALIERSIILVLPGNLEAVKHGLNAVSSFLPQAIRSAQEGGPGE